MTVRLGHVSPPCDDLLVSHDWFENLTGFREEGYDAHP